MKPSPSRKRRELSQLFSAAERGDVKKLESLLRQRLDPNCLRMQKDSIEKTPLILAAARGHIDTIKCLLRNGAQLELGDKPSDPTANRNRRPLQYAASAGALDAVIALLDAGAKVDARDSAGATPFTSAATNGHIGVVRQLIHAGANVRHVPKGDFSALHGAVACGHEEIVGLLLQSGADPNARNRFGDTPIIAPYVSVAIMTKLIAAGADIDSSSKDGWTVLMYAARLGRVDAVRLLIESGATVDLKNSDGDTATALAGRFGYPGIARLLISRTTAVSHPRSKRHLDRNKRRESLNLNGQEQQIDGV